MPTSVPYFPYSKEKFTETRVILGDRPWCLRIDAKCDQAYRDDIAIFLSQFHFRVESCAKCPHPRTIPATK